MYAWPDDSQGDFNLNERLVMSQVLNGVKDALLNHFGGLDTPIHFKPRIGQPDVAECYGWQCFRGHIAQDRREVILTKALTGDFLATFRVDWAEVTKSMPEPQRGAHMATKPTGMKSYVNNKAWIDALKKECIDFLRHGIIPMGSQPLEG